VPLRGAYMFLPPHHSQSRPEPITLADQVIGHDEMEKIDLCERIQRGGRKFFPLFRKSMGVTCGLKVLFMRQEARGRVYLDGRLKTLLDALSAPAQDNEVCDDPDCPPLVYTLLENDELVPGLEVQTERLLSRADEGEDSVRLVVTADVRVTVSRQYNRNLPSDSSNSRAASSHRRAHAGSPYSRRQLARSRQRAGRAKGMVVDMHPKYGTLPLAHGRSSPGSPAYLASRVGAKTIEETIDPCSPSQQKGKRPTACNRLWAFTYEPSRRRDLNPRPPEPHCDAIERSGRVKSCGFAA
jgi:hypothetical protein